MEVLEGARIYRPIKTVAIAADVPANADGGLLEKGIAIVRDQLKEVKTPEELKTALQTTGADALITRTSLDVNDAVLRGTGLQLVMGACKNPKVDRNAARERGVEVLGTHENTDQVVQHVMAAIHAFATGLVSGAITTRQNKWNKREIGDANFDTRDKKLGILGFGRIGRRLAETARLNGLQVGFFNDSGEFPRKYDSKLAKAARYTGARRIGSKEELFSWADIVTIHTGDRNFRDESNKNLVTVDDLNRMAGNDRLGIFINYDRADLVPCPEEIQGLLDAGILKGFATDVFPKDREKEGAFKYPFKVDDNHHVITTPHIAGSNPELLRRAANHAVARLLEWDKNGNIADDSLTYTRVELPFEPYEGQVCVAVRRSTRPGIFKDVVDVCGLRGKLSIVGTRQTEDYIPGTRQNRGIAYQIVYCDQANHMEYDKVVRSLVHGLVNLNRHEEGYIRSIKIIPSTLEQKQALQEIQL